MTTPSMIIIETQPDRRRRGRERKDRRDADRLMRMKARFLYGGSLELSGERCWLSRSV
jgi:hypothetical protein